MAKMEFLKRKHFSLWIITAFVVVSGYVSVSDGLQGVPTWICLGVKSPFIEFGNEIEVLANNSIPLNVTKDEQALMHQEGLRKLGTFIKPVDLRDSTTGYVKANLTKKIPSSHLPIHRRIHPIQEEMDQKQIILLDEETDENGLPASLTEEDRKFIVPMALKNPMPPDIRVPQPPPMFRAAGASASALAAAAIAAPTRIFSTITASTTTQRPPTIAAASLRSKKMTMPAIPEFASNIDDLKNHLLFLQNLTKHDSNFQSKFVVFPSLQKDKPLTTTTLRPLRPIFQYSAPIPPPTRKIPAGVKPGGQPFGGYYHNEDETDSMSVFLSQPGSNPRDKITIVPQVLLLNDQTTSSAAIGTNNNNGRRRINTNRSASTQTPPFTMTTPLTTTRTTTTTSTTTTTTTTTTTEMPTTTTQSSTRPTKKPVCLRNPESPKCIRQRKREEQQRKEFRERLLREQQQYFKPYGAVAQTLNNTKRFAVSIEIPDSFKYPLNETSTTPVLPEDESELQVLSRSARSHHKRRNIGGGLQGRDAGDGTGGGNNEKFSGKYGSPSFSFERAAIMTSAAVANERDFLLTHMDHMNHPFQQQNASTPSPTVAAYSEPTDLNPDNCYLVDGLTYGQKKQCVIHTSVMPAISRGARAAIQECQYQFKNRRWNCSTVEDNTVFGPMTGLGSPEMAFIHALAAATVTSFIARACRDGQLASCGCSRGSRPKQLHDDWTWGGCGDNLEYAYKFATDFIDVREKETRRGTRGVGNPERRRARLHQRRFQQQQQQQQQQLQQPMMLADDANINGASTVDKRLNSLISATSTNVKLTSTSTTATATTTTTTTTMQTITNEENSNGNANDDINFKITIRNEDIKRQGMPTTDNNQQISNKTANSKAKNSSGDNNNNNNRMFETATETATSKRKGSKDETIKTATTATTTMTTTTATKPRSSMKTPMSPPKHDESSEEDLGGRIKPEDLLELQERITKEILNSKLQEKEMLELQEKINREILNSKVFSKEGKRGKRKRKNQRAINGMGGGGHGSGVQADAGYTTINANGGGNGNGAKWKNGASVKARSLMNLHNNEAGRRAVIKKTRITCKCHGVSGSCSLITCWQQLSSIREIGDYLREKYEESTEVKLNKRGRLQVKDPQFKVPTAHDLVYLDESPDWCRNSRQLQWPGTHGRVCNKTSSGLDGCGILCCGRGYNTKNIVVRERCNCKFHWCCHVKCDVCVKVLEEHTCK